MPLDPILKKFIDKAVSEGRTANDIGKSISEAGWGLSHIQEAERYYGSKKKSSQSTSEMESGASTSRGPVTTSSLGLPQDVVDFSIGQQKKYGLLSESGQPTENVNKGYIWEATEPEDESYGRVFNAFSEIEAKRKEIEETSASPTYRGPVNERPQYYRPTGFPTSGFGMGMGSAMGAGMQSPYDTRPALSEDNRQARIAQLQKEKKEAAQNFIKQSEISYNALLPKARAYGEEVPDFYDFNGDPSQGIDWVTSKAGKYQKEQLSKLREDAIKEAEKSNWVGRGLNSFVYNFIGAADAFGAAINFAGQTAVGGKPWEDDYTETELGQFAREGSEMVRKGALGEKFLAGYTLDEIQKGVSKNILEGNYEAGLGLLGLESLEMVPQLAAAMAPGGVGLRLLATTSAGDAWARVASDPKYNTAEKIAYAGLLGLAEYYTEKIFSADRDAIRGMLGIVQERGKKGLGEAMFGRLPKGFRAFVEEGFEESVVDLVTQGLDYAMAGKEFDAYQLADATLLGGVMGGGAFVLSKSPNALGRIPGLQTKIKFDSDIQRIKDILDSKDLSTEERGVLSARLNDLLAESRRTEEQNMMFYEAYSEEDKKRTYELNQEVLRLMELHKKTKTDIAKKAITDEIKQKISEIQQIESNYDSKKGQQVPSQVAQGKELGPVPIEGRSAEEAETSGVLQEVEDEEKLAGEKTQALEQEQPDLEPSNFDNVTEETAPTVANTLYDYISNTAEAAFKALGTSRRQAARAADSVLNAINSLTKAGKKVNIKVFYSKASMEDWLGSMGERPEAARGIYVPPGSENKNEITIGLLAPALVSNTAYHEGLHSVVPAVFGKDGIKRLFKVLMNKLSKSDALGEYLRDFASSEQYQESEDQWEEFSVELASLIADGSVSISVKKGIIDKFMDAMSEVLGIVGIEVRPSAAQLVNILNDYAQKLGTGAELGEIEDMLEGNTEPGPVAPTQEIRNPVRYEKIIKTKNSYKLSYVNPTNVVDIEKLIDKIVSEGKTVLFWAGDQLGVGQYKDPFTKKKYDLQGGPSYMLNPTNVKRGAVWATGLSAKSLSERIKRDKVDYVFIISGGPLSMMFFNGLVLDMWVDRAQSAFENIDSFKESLGKAIVGKKSEALNDFNSWGELKEGLKNKKTLNKTRNVIKGLAETKTKRGLEFLNQYGLNFDSFNDIRDGYFKDNKFDILDITTIYKPTVAIDGQSNHLTYPNVVMGELVGIPDRKVSSRDVMTEDFLSSVTKRGKERRGLPPSQIIKAIAGEIGMVQGVSRPRKVKRMKISGIPKFVETLDIRITPATTARVQIRVPDEKKNDIKKLSKSYNKLLTDYSKSGDNSKLRRIDEVASQIMDGAKKRLKDNISRVRGAAIQFGDNYIGIWGKIFEPSFKLKLRITPESNEAAISRELALFGERYNQDGIIVETASEMEQQWINGEIDMPLAYNDENGFTHFPQLLHNFDKELSDQQLADLSLKLKDEGVSFSMNKDELIVSIFPELEPNQENLSENEQYRAKESIFNDIFDKVTRSINDVLRNNEEITPSIRIAKSIYIGGEKTSRKWRSNEGGKAKGKTYNTRTYDRSNFLKAFKEGLSNEEKLIPEFVALRNEEIQLSKQKKRLSPEKQARYDALRKIIQPLAESTFATNKNFYRATRLELNSIAEKYANEIDGAFASTFSIKRPARAAVKSLRWYGAATDELGDGARVNIIVRNEEDADKLFEKLDNDFPAKGKEERRVRQETELGYPKRLLEVRNDLGFIGEIQVMTMNGYLAKDGVSYFNPERKDDARDSLKKVQERIGWNIPDGLGHYFYEINRDENIDDSLRNQALFLSNGYYSAFNDPNFNLKEDYFLAEVADFKKKVDNADKSNWDEGNKGESPMSLNRYLRSKGVKAPSKKTKKQIIGDSSKMSSWVRASKFKAVMMEEEGIDSEQIYFATGWERGTDKNWRYEAEPIKLTQKGIEDLIDKDDIVSLASLIEARPSDMPRSKDNETLLDFYPQLKDVDVLIAPYGSRTFYSYNEKVIQISKNVVDLGMDEFYLTIVHEVQHAVQHIEGFAVGAGLSSVESQLRSAITDAYDLRMTALAKSESIADDYQMVYEDFLADKENAEGEEIKDLPNSDSFIAYDKYKTYVEIVNSATFEYNFLEGLLKTRMQPNGKELITDFELYMAFAGEAEARNASRRAKMSKEERRSTPLSRSEDIVRDEQIVQYPGEVTSPEVKRQALGKNLKRDVSKVSRMSAGSFSGRMYNYLLSLTTEDDQGQRKIAISKTEWVNTMAPIIGANEASDMYDNVLNDKIPQDAIDTSLTSNIDKAYEDSLSKIERETRKAVFTIENTIVKLLDRQHLIKAAVLKANIKRVKSLIVNKAGSSSRALHFVRSWEKRIYKGLSEEEAVLLDKLIALRRVKTIDDNFAQRYNDALDEYNDAMQQLSNQQPGTPKYDKLLAKAERAQRKIEEAKPPTHPEGINGITASLEMARMRESIGNERFNGLDERASEYFDAFSSILDEMYREGMVSEKLYEQLAGLDYQPRIFLEHMFADMDQNMMTEHRLTGPIIKRLKEGSDKEMLFNSRYLLRIYAKNAFSRIARNKIHKELAKYADTQTWISSSPRTGFSEITFYGEKGRKKGVQQTFYLKNDLYNSLNDVFKYAYLSPKAQNIIGMISGARLLKFFATQVNPLFVVKNIPRDFLHILFFTDFYDKSPLPVAAFRLGMDYISGIKSKITEDKWFNLYIKYGGGMEFLSTEGEESVGLGYVPNAKKTMMGKLGMKTSEVLSKSKEALGYLGELSEIAPRIGVFRALVERNLREANVDIRSGAAEPIIEEAVAMVREIIDFAQGGELTKAGESAIPYLNAAFQGFRVASRYAFVSNPKQFAYKLAQLSVAVFALALYNSSVGDDDMEDISDDIKFRNWIILTPFRDKDGNRFYLKIAKSQQLQSFAYLGEIASEAFVASQKDREPRINDDLGDVALKAVGGYLPKDVGKLDKEIATANPFLAAIYTYKSNYDAFRDAVVSRDYALEGKNKVFPQYEDFYDKNVPYFYKAIGQGLGVGPKRLQASTEKMITSPHSSLLVMGGYALADSFSRMFELKGPDGLTLKDQSDISKSVAERFDVDAKKVFLGVTNPETKSYEKREQIDESNMDSNTKRMFIKREADKWGQKLYEMRSQPNANTSANIDTYNKTIDSINAELSSIYDKQGEQTAEYFRNRVFVVAKKGSDIPQEYNDLLFASDDLARAKILYMYDKSMSEQEIYDYMGSYSEVVGRNVSREQNIRIAEEYNKLKK